MRRSPGIWRRRLGILVVAGLFLAGNLAFFFAYGSTSRTREIALEERRVALAKEVEAAEAEAARLTAQRDKLAQVSEALEEFYGRRVGPRRETLAPLVADLHALLRRAEVRPTQTSYSTSAVKGLPLSQMVVTFGFQSDYRRFKRLLREIEDSRRWIFVREVTLAGDSESPGEVQVAIVLATYFSEEPLSGAGQVRAGSKS